MDRPSNAASDLTDIEDDGLVPDVQFDQILTSEQVASFLCDQLAVRVDGLRQALMLGALDRPGMVAVMRNLSGDAERMNLVESAADFANWMEDMAEVAMIVAQRSLVAIAEIGNALKPVQAPDVAEKAA